MEYYTIDDIKEFLKSKGYVWKGEVWDNGFSPSKVTIDDLYGRTKPIVLFVLYKDGEKFTQYISVFDTSFKLFEEQLGELNPGHNKFLLQEDYSSEWADFLAERHNNINAD